MIIRSRMLKFDGYSDPNYGREIQTWGLSRELAKQRHKVTLIEGIAKGVAGVGATEKLFTVGNMAKTNTQSCRRCYL